jgi:hypothetical protein
MNAFDEENRAANLRFFIESIFKNALWLYGDSHIMNSFNIIEVVHWASLGVQIGYLSWEDVHDLISSSIPIREGVSPNEPWWYFILIAWERLRETISPEDDWLQIIAPQQGKPALDPRWFYVCDLSGRRRELLHCAFQTFSLLTRELIFDNSSHYFLEKIGWASDNSAWNLRKPGTVFETGHARDIAAGFSNILSYWQEVEAMSISIARDDVGENAVSDSRSPFADDWRRWVPRNVGFPQYSQGLEVPNFLQHFRTMVSRRFNLGQIEVMERYFLLAGEFVNSKRENTLEWHDVHLRSFSELSRFMSYFGAGERIQEFSAHFWNLFTGSSQTSFGSGVTGRP